MEDLKPYLDKFSESGRRVLECAYNETRRRSHYYLSPEHILYALMREETELFNAAMLKLPVDPNAIQLAVLSRLENSSGTSQEEFRLAPETTNIFKCSMDRARAENRRTIEASDICTVLATLKYDLLDNILQNPAGSIQMFRSGQSGIGPVQPGTGERQSYFFPKPLIAASKFSTQFSLRELVEKNTSSSELLFSGHAGIGGTVFGSGSGGGSPPTFIKHESMHRPIKPTALDKFDEQEFIGSLRKDVEEKINTSGLKITSTHNLNLSSFRLQYTGGNVIKGEISISGEIQNECYNLKAMVVEEIEKKTK